MKKVLVVFGTRPEAIKMAPVVIELAKHSDKLKSCVCVTAQHREMLDQVLSIFGIAPDIDLNIMKNGQDLTDVTTRVLEGMRDVLKQQKPDLVLVHGDTTTSMAASLAAYYQQIPIGHIEAGLRTYNKYSPWPEEINRQITDKIADYLFVPTELNKNNLIQEGLSCKNIFITGNTVIDALFHSINKIENDTSVLESVVCELENKGIPLKNIKNWNGKSGSRQMVLVTGHRRENFGDGFINICEAIKILASENSMVDFVYPMHLNPNVRKAVSLVFNNEIIRNTYLIEPLEYLSFIYLMKKSAFILTDSGGIQEEAQGLGKPVLLMRDTTERAEALETGSVKLIGTDKELIVSETIKLLYNINHYNDMVSSVNPYGNGKASVIIVDLVKSILR